MAQAVEMAQPIEIFPGVFKTYLSYFVTTTVAAYDLVTMGAKE